MAIKATLRKKFISGNKISLYLDFYPPILNPKTGKTTRREFLNLTLESEIETILHHYKDENGNLQKKIVPVLNKAGNPKLRKLKTWDKNQNKYIEELAEKIRIRRENEINKPLIYSDLEIEKLKEKEFANENFIEYYKKEADKKRGSAERYNWSKVYKRLYDFTGGILPFNKLDEKFCIDFREYLLRAKAYEGENTIHQNTACTYFVKFKAGVKQAWSDKKIPYNVGANVTNIKLIDSQRNFLTIEELNKLVKTDCKDPVLKKAFLFSCLTGLRKSDILALTWGKIERIDNKYAIRYTQQKTKGAETLYISEQAFNLLGEHGDPDEKVFPGLIISSYYSKYLLLWLGEAGIKKEISFHNARHSYATLQLASGTDLKVVSKMLGHKSIRTTEIYAKVIDKLKQEAAERIKLDL